MRFMSCADSHLPNMGLHRWLITSRHTEPDLQVGTPQKQTTADDTAAGPNLDTRVQLQKVEALRIDVVLHS
jgi:hypothetical protein